MKYLSEKEAEEVLEKFGFNVVDREYCSKESKIPDILKRLGLPIVMKVSGENIVHKKKLGGVNTDINNYAEALNEFRRMKKMKGAKGVMFQKKIDFNREFLVGVKKTEEFGHVILFGSGGSDVEEKKDVAFRVCPFSVEDVYDMFSEVKVMEGIGHKDQERIASFVLGMCDFVSKYSKIEEMDVNPMVLGGTGPIILDSRILFG